jgi:hypothetical protein
VRYLENRPAAKVALRQSINTMIIDEHSTQDEALSRRHFLWSMGGGLGAIALACLLNEEAAAKTVAGGALRTHFPAKAKRVIQIFCCGGVSHVDTFDYKPDLVKHDGKELTDKGKIDTFFGQPGRIMKSPFEFLRRGKSGLYVSSLLPHLAECADDMTFLYAMKAKSSNHTPATFQMNAGFTMNGFPCLGAWLSYGLGSENQDLPAFVVLPDPRGLPAGGAINWTSGFLPATHQGVAFNTVGQPVDDLLPPPDVDPAKRRAGLALLNRLNRDYHGANPGDSALAARIRSYELAARMQVSIPQVVDFAGETASMKRSYGLDNPLTEGFGRNCLLARRLLERGVRFVQLYHGGAFGSPRINWDAHEDLVENHTKQAVSMDQPVAALLKDLKARGMLDDTLISWTTEFGRTPITQGVGAKGRDHHPHGFTVWMAGAGLRPGFGFGATDEVGYHAVDNATEVYDLHATVLHLLGLDHKRLTYYHNGIQRRLTDVHGHLIEPILA